MAAPHHKLKFIALALTLGVAGLISGPALANHDGPSFGVVLTHGSHDRHRNDRRRHSRDRDYDRRRYDYRDGFYNSRSNNKHRRHFRRSHRDRRPSWLLNIRRPGIYFLERGHWAHYYYVDDRRYGYCDERGRHSHGSLNFSW